MTSYARLDVSQQETQICILDAAGAVRWTGKARSEPAALAAVLQRRAPDLARAVLESGALSASLGAGCAGRGSVEAGLPALCIDARAAHGALKQRHSQTDRGDAEGLARLAQTGWFKVVRLKPGGPRAARAAGGARAAGAIQRDLLSQVRGLVKPLGLVLPRTTPRRLTARIEAWLDEAPGMRPAIAALLAARTRIADELERLDRLLSAAGRRRPGLPPARQHPRRRRHHRHLLHERRR